jgi:hypothetical protein
VLLVEQAAKTTTDPHSGGYFCIALAIPAPTGFYQTEPDWPQRAPPALPARVRRRAAAPVSTA